MGTFKAWHYIDTLKETKCTSMLEEHPTVPYVNISGRKFAITCRDVSREGHRTPVGHWLAVHMDCNVLAVDVM